VHNAIQQAFGAEKQCFTDILVKVQSQLENLLNTTEIFLTLSSKRRQSKGLALLRPQCFKV